MKRRHSESRDLSRLVSEMFQLMQYQVKQDSLSGSHPYIQWLNSVFEDRSRYLGGGLIARGAGKKAEYPSTSSFT